MCTNRVKQGVVQKVLVGVAVVVTRARVGMCWLCWLLQPAWAAELPKERFDVMSHSYHGGGMEIQGPAVLVRKNVGSQWSLAGHYYIDEVTGASVDVLTYASPYEEERTEFGVDWHYLQDKTSVTGGYVQSDENDYNAKNARIDISQSVFGDLTTVSLGFSRGWDTVGNRTDASFAEPVDRQNYRFGVSQVLTPRWVGSLGFELITDEGFLNNPYRQVRYVSASNFYEFEPEVYPNTRTSYALSLAAMQSLTRQVALGYRYRYFTDSWDVRSHTTELEYRHRYADWLFYTTLRLYTQSQADFYSDLFPTP